MPYARKTYRRKRSAVATRRRTTKKYARKKSAKRTKRRATRKVFSQGLMASGTSMLAKSRLVTLSLTKTFKTGTFSETSYLPTEIPFNITDISDLEDQLTSDFGTAVDVPGYSLMTQLYQRYCVVGFKCTARIIDRSGPAEAGATWNAEDAYAHGFVVDMKDISSGSYPLGYEYNNPDEMFTKKYAVGRIESGIDISVRKTAPMTTCKWSMKKYFNIKDVKDNQTYYGGIFKTATNTGGALNTQKAAVRCRFFQVPMWVVGMDAHPMRWQVEYKASWSVVLTQPNDNLAGL